MQRQRQQYYCISFRLERKRGVSVNDRVLVWIWLQDCLGFCKSGVKKIFDVFEKPEDILTADEKTLRQTRLFNEHTIVKMMYRDFRYAKKIYDDCQRLGYDIVPLLHEDYPEKLLQINDPPLLLYVNGKIPQTKNVLCTAVIGSRKATEESKKMALDISVGLAMNHVLVVSGGADGVDTQAHLGALTAGSKTVCVLGCGLNYNYLIHSEELKRKIARSGAVITEYPPYAMGQRHTFIQRDRIIAGMCDCTAVVQAGIKSGSLTTARDTLKFRRKLFVMGDTPDTPAFAGLKELIRDGAAVMKTHEDILRWYHGTDDMTEIPERESVLPQNDQEPELHFNYYVHKEESKQTLEQAEKKFLSELLTENAVMVYHTISDVPVDMDYIGNAVDLEVPAITAALTELELSGLVVQLAGKRYIRK